MEVLINLTAPPRPAPSCTRAPALALHRRLGSALLLLAALTLAGCPALRAPVLSPSPSGARLSVDRVTESGLYLRVIPAESAPPASLRLERAAGEEQNITLYELTLNDAQRDAWRRGLLELRDPEGVAQPELRYDLLVAPSDESPWELAAALQTRSRALPSPPAALEASAAQQGVALRWEPSAGLRVRLMRRTLGTPADEAPAPWQPLADLEPSASGAFLDRSARPGDAFAYTAQHIDPRAPAPHLGAFGSPVYVALPQAP